jgi:ornithine carbamoyltransferase
MPDHFLSFFDLHADDLRHVIEQASELKRDFDTRTMRPLLQGKRIAAIWDADGFRNRVAFELGARLLGAEIVEVPYNFERREEASDIARYLSNWFDAVIVRTAGHAALQAFAAAASVPVINARTRHNHPCEILGDLAYIYAERGSIENLNVVYVGQASNICRSWLDAAATLPIRVTHVVPRGFEVDTALWQDLTSRAAGRLHASQDLEALLGNADVVYTDTWPSDGDADAVRDSFLPYQISAAVLEMTSPSCLFLPCPPVHRGEEVTAEAMESSRCKVYEAKEYLLHAQNALLVHLLT